MSFTIQQLEGLYLAYFGRPADADGLAFYLAHPEMDIWAIAKAFSASPESQALYGATFNSGVIDSIYQNLFNRSAESAGLQYWSGEVSAGRLSAAGAAYGILLGAQNSDLTAVNNKLAVCAAFTNAMDTAQEKAGYSGSAAATMARAFVHTVDSTQTELSLGLAYVPEQVAAITSGNAAVANAALAGGESFALASGPSYFLAADGFASGFVWNHPVVVSGLASGSMLEFAGSTAELGVVQAQIGADTASDVLTIKENPAYYDDNNAISASKGDINLMVYAPGVEHVNFIATATQLTDLSVKAAGWQPDYRIDGLNLISSPQLQTVVVTGDQPVGLSGDFPVLQSVDASQLAPIATEPDLVPNVGFIFHLVDGSTSPVALVIGSQHTGNELYGTSADNTLVGGPEADLLQGGGGSDTLTGGGGNDVFRYIWSTDSDYARTPTFIDTITDFSANTVGSGVHGALSSQQASWNGDVIDLRAYMKSTIAVSVATDASSAANQLATFHAAGGYDITAVLDSSTGWLYIDTNADGTADLDIVLNGVQTLTTAAFMLTTG